MRLLGHQFRPMTDHDRIGFAGAGPADLIAEAADGTTLIFDPERRTVQEILPDGKWRDWTTQGELS